MARVGPQHHKGEKIKYSLTQLSIKFTVFSYIFLFLRAIFRLNIELCVCVCVCVLQCRKIDGFSFILIYKLSIRCY